MAEGDGSCYQGFVRYVMEGIINLDAAGDTLKVALVTGYTPDIDAHEIWAGTAVSGKEVTGTGYTSPGAALTSQVVSEVGTAHTSKGKFDAADLTWTGLNIAGTSASPSHAILYDDTVTAPADILIAYWEVTTATNGGDYTLAWNTAGIVTISV
jgi:hypothetical protein